jgi:soluble lytic murein transglycosylase
MLDRGPGATSREQVLRQAEERCLGFRTIEREAYIPHTDGRRSSGNRAVVAENTAHGEKATLSAPLPGTEAELTGEPRRRVVRRAGRYPLRWMLAGLVAASFQWSAFPAAAELAHRGPPHGSAAWLRGQALLESPGPALAAGHEAYEQGDLRRAEWLFAEIALRHPIIGDYADLMLARVAGELGRLEDATALLARGRESYPDSTLRAEFSSELGHVLASTGDEEAARLAWRDAYDHSNEDELRADLLLATAVSEERSGDAEAAAQTYTLVWALYPRVDAATVAEQRLAVLEPSLGLERDGKAWRRRGDTLFRKRNNEAALAAYETALSLGLSTSETSRLEKKRAQTLFRLRLYPDAVQAFERIPQSGDIPIWHARSLARAGRVPESIAEFEELANHRDGNVALRARFLAALLLDGRGEMARARRYLEGLTRGASKSSVGRAALWRLAWGAYREARYADAISSLDRLIAVEQDPIGVLRSRYWRARCIEGLARVGRPSDAGRKGSVVGAALGAESEAAAAIEFQLIADEYPLSYYGWRARMRVPPGFAANSQAGEGADLDRKLPASGKRKLAPQALERARILLEGGFTDWALDELAAASLRVGGLSDRLELAQLFSNAGSYRDAQRLVVDPYQETLARGPAATLEQLWWHAWPAAYPDLIAQVTRGPGSVSPALVLSIMREESGFRPTVVSTVGARGLLQIMEPTGERLARAVGHENFSPDDLFDPLTNLRLGAHYLAELSRRFDGRLSAAIASYNAGPIAVSGWIEERSSDDDDEWVESIPYDQTRQYVKRVLRSLQAYRLLY